MSSAEEANVVHSVFLTWCILSVFFGSCLLIFRILLRQFARRHGLWPKRESALGLLLLQRVFALIVDCTSGFLDATRSREECVAQASIQVATEVTGVLFIAIVSIALVLLITGRIRESKLRSLVLPLSIVTWTVGFTCLTVVALEDAFDDTGPWCWISQKRIDLRFACLYGWVLFAFLVVICSFVAIAIHVVRMRFRLLDSLRQQHSLPSSASSDDSRNHLGRDTMKIMVIPVILIFCWWCPTTIRMGQMSEPNFGTSFAWQMMQTVIYFECAIMSFYYGWTSRTWLAAFYFAVVVVKGESKLPLSRRSELNVGKRASAFRGSAVQMRSFSGSSPMASAGGEEKFGRSLPENTL